MSYDPYWSSVVSALHFNNNWSDYAGLDWNIVGTPANNGSPKFGSGSAVFDGVGDVLYDPSDTVIFSTFPFTIECWVKPTDLTGPRMINTTNWDGTTQYGYLLSMSHLANDGRITFFVRGYNPSSPMLTSTAALVAGQWTHIAVTRESNIFRLYVNGNKEAEVTANVTLSSAFRNIGGYSDASGSFVAPSLHWKGSIDDFRATAGVARYTGNTYTVPTEQFPDTDVPPEQDFFPTAPILVSFFDRDSEAGDLRVTEDGTQRETETHYTNVARSEMTAAARLTPFASTLLVKFQDVWRGATVFVKNGGNWVSPSKMHRKVNNLWKRTL